MASIFLCGFGQCANVEIVPNLASDTSFHKSVEVDAAAASYVAVIKIVRSETGENKIFVKKRYKGLDSTLAAWFGMAKNYDVGEYLLCHGFTKHGKTKYMVLYKLDGKKATSRNGHSVTLERIDFICR